MPYYRRTHESGATYFFTVVTYQRRPVFADELAIHLLEQCLQTTMSTLRFVQEAFVVLPDHLHAIWTLPENDGDFSTRWKLIKGSFSHQYQKVKREDVPESLRKKGESGVWQRRFWEHLVRDQTDFNRHCDYPLQSGQTRHGGCAVRLAT
jgi:putative transposase